MKAQICSIVKRSSFFANCVAKKYADVIDACTALLQLSLMVTKGTLYRTFLSTFFQGDIRCQGFRNLFSLLKLRKKMFLHKNASMQNMALKKIRCNVLFPSTFIEIAWCHLVIICDLVNPFLTRHLLCKWSQTPIELTQSLYELVSVRGILTSNP